MYLTAATLIINDDVQAAEEGLNKGNSSFHKVRATVHLEDSTGALFAWRAHAEDRVRLLSLERASFSSSKQPWASSKMSCERVRNS